MGPVNQVILGGDPLLGGTMLGSNLDSQLQMLEKYRQSLEAAKQSMQQQAAMQHSQRLIWDEIDVEVEPLTDEQKNMLFSDNDYAETYALIQGMVQSEILNMVKAKIESTPEGKELLQNQLKNVKRLKSKIINETNREMELFKKFKEFSKANPGITYEEFIKANT